MSEPESRIITSDDRGRWWVWREDGQEGPYSWEELQRLDESPCRCDVHRGMTADQAWATLP